MATMTNTIINFQQRRQLEEALARLAHIESEAQLREAVRQIAHTFPADVVTPALLRWLDTPDSQLRGGLGHLAALLPHEAITAALRNFAGDRRNAPVARMTAMTIAQRHLGVEFSATLVGDLSHSDDAAFQSLLDAISEGKRNRHVLLEYVMQMRELGEEVAFLVLDALQRTAPGDRVELLRLIAQDSRPAIASAALAALAALSATDAGVQAARALHTLSFTTPPDLAHAAERSARKLGMAGHRHTPASPSGWRALLSPAEPNGNQTIWIVQDPQPEATTCALLGFTVHLGVGIVHFFGSETIDASVLPKRHALGEMFAVQEDNGRHAVLLEAPFDYGRWLVLSALRAQLALSPPRPTPGEYQLYNDLLWQFAEPQLEAPLALQWAAPSPDAALPDAETLTAATVALFAHPVMADWAYAGGAILQATPAPARPDPALPVAELVPILLREIARWPESSALSPTLERALRAQAAWLQLAGETATAAHARLLAAAMPTLPIAQNPVLAQMLTAGLQSKSSRQ